MTAKKFFNVFLLIKGYAVLGFLILKMSIILSAFFILAISSCTSKAMIELYKNGDSIITLETVPSGKILKELSGGNDGSAHQYLDKAELEKQAKNSFIEILSAESHPVEGIKIKFKVSGKKNTNEFIVNDPAKGFFRCSIDSKRIKEIIEMLSEENREYIDLFMAPVITGEKLTEKEYEELLASAYGNKLAAGLINSLFIISLDCPAKIISIKAEPFGETETFGKKATIRVPLIKLLTMHNAFSLNVNYKK